MGHIQKYRRPWAAVAALLTAILVGCGGGGDPGVPAGSKFNTLVVEGYAPAVTKALQPNGIQKRNATVVPVPSRVHLAAPVVRKADTYSDFGPKLIGFARDVSATQSSADMQKQLQWSQSESGAHIAAVSFTSDGAQGLRLGLLVNTLPGSALVRVYSQDKPDTVYQIAGQEILQRLQLNAAAGDTSEEGRTWWTPEFGNSEVTLEIELPVGVSSASLDVAVPRVSHIFEALELPREDDGATELQTKINESGSCNLDATCNDAYANQRNAVARMIYTEGGSSYLCTGTLINDAASSGTPYFLSANHCISTQTAASSLQTDWFYRSPTCNSRTLSTATTKRFGGATLLYASASTDTSFMRLNDAAPAGTFFVGWNVGQSVATGTTIAVLHHPKGDLLKISLGSIIAYASCSTANASGSFSCSGATNGNYYATTFSDGVTEGGSSGSSLLTRDGRYILGTLYGGTSACTAGGRTAGPDFYGRFDVAYQAGGLDKWLNAATTSSRRPIYRFYNAKTGAHFFTADTAERDYVIQTLPGFAYEGTAFYAYSADTTGQNPVYRFYNRATAAHFYTIDVSERNYVQSSLPTYQYEGAAWAAQIAAATGTSPIYRFYNREIDTHFYTISSAERDFIIANNPGYQYEGAKYYAWTSQ